MSGIGAASFVEGLQGGIASRDQMDRNKQFKQMRKIGIREAELGLEGKRDWAQANQMDMLGGDYDQAAFDEEWGAFQQDKDPALMRFGKFLGGKMKGMFGGGGEETGATEQMAIATPRVQAAGPQASGATTYAMPEQKADGGIMSRQRYADGGEVETAEEKRARYASMVERDDEGNPVTSGGGVGAFARDYGRSLAETAHPRNTFPNVMAEADRYGDMERVRRQNVIDAPTAQKRGGAIRDYAGEAIMSSGRQVGALADDLLGPIDEGIIAGAKGVAGFFGFEGDEPTEGVPTTDVPSTPEGEAIGASVDNPDTPPEAVAGQAIKDAQEDAIANYDYKLLVDQGVRPEELPSMSTKDWTGYRERMTMGAIKQGMNPTEAHQMVDQRITDSQMVGFQREGNKAMLYLQSGQAREASMALRQAYQYFPNGVTVKFGTMTDPKTGQPSIITMGVDEETGEPSGSPMIITTERLSTMMENMQNPDAFRSWTKDGRDLQMEINKLQSVDDYRQGSLDISAYNAETSRIGALTGGGSGGITPGERRQRDQMYAKAMTEAGYMEEGMEDPRLLRSLTGAMIRLEMASGLPPGIALEEVMRAHSDGGTEGVQRLLEEQTGQ